MSQLTATHSVALQSVTDAPPALRMMDRRVVTMMLPADQRCFAVVVVVVLLPSTAVIQSFTNQTVFVVVVTAPTASCATGAASTAQ